MAGPDLSKRIVYRVDGMGNVRVRRDVYKRDAGAELAMPARRAQRSFAGAERGFERRSAELGRITVSAIQSSHQK